MASILAVDVGNSYIKWGVSRDHQWLVKRQVSHLDVQKLFAQWNRLSNIECAVISSVSHR